jgi:transposase
MEVVHERCCGLDVHKRTVVACLLTPGEGGQPAREVRTFGTMGADLLQLREWLVGAGCRQAAMESTGVYWKPVYNALEGAVELLVVNTQQVKMVPGRKTDVSDAEWLADLLRHGLLRGSFVPPAPQRELRELTRYRAALVRERAREVNRLQKTLEGTNLKLGSVATDILGVSGRAILEAVARGESEATVLAGLARGRLREKRTELERALAGQVKPHHRLLITEHLEHIGYLNEAIARVSREIEERLGPFEETLARLQTVPGVGPRTAEVLMAEVGRDMSRFPSHRHLASWAGLCPGNNESAGKRKSGKTRKGSPWLRSALVEAAWAASHSKRTYLSAQYHRLAARRGGKRAVVAVAHTLLVIVYHLLKGGETYSELGGNYFDERDRWQVERRLVRRLEALGYTVCLQPAA